MITPLVSDEAWLDHFAGHRSWEPSDRPALVVAPHPDDETLGAGGLIASLTAHGVDVWVVAATDGENCYDLPQEQRSRLALLRKEEQRAALELLGVPQSRILRLHLTDSGLQAQQQELTASLHSIAKQGMQLIAPWIGDFHPDHIACAIAAREVAMEKQLPLTSYFFWTWHRGTPASLDHVSPVLFRPERWALNAKQAALAAHRSQLAYAPFDPILPKNLLGPASWPFEVYLAS